MMFAFAFSAILFTACEKETPIAIAEEALDVEVLNVVAEPITDAELSNDVAIVEGATGRVALGPDLVVAGVASTLPNTGPCAVPVGQPQLPNGTCNGGSTPNSFTVLARIKNLGNSAVAAGSFKVSWAISGSALQGITIVNHTGIPAGSAIAISRGWTLGCPAGGIVGLTRRDFTVTVDISNDVAERNELNNVSRPYTICDDI